MLSSILLDSSYSCKPWFDDEGFSQNCINLGNKRDFIDPVEEMLEPLNFCGDEEAEDTAGDVGAVNDLDFKSLSSRLS